MKRQLKKCCAVFLSMMMLVTSLSVGFTASAELVEGDVDHIVVEPIELIENFVYHGNSDEGFFGYEWQNFLSYTVVLTDGTQVSGTGTEFVYFGDGYYIEYESKQTAQTPWLAGNTYTGTITLLGVTAEVPVTILESPIVSVEFEPCTYIENYDGYMTEDETGTYFNYDRWYSDLSWTATLNDGSTITGGEYYTYNDSEEYYVWPSTTQSAQTPWTVGGDNTVEVSILGRSYSFNVEIIESPVASVEIKPITVIENNDGRMVADYDDATETESEQYFRYDWESWDKLRYKVTMKDKTVYELEGLEWFEYNGKGYSIDTEDTQSFTNQWTAGNTYTVTVKLLGKDYPVEVSVIDSPVKEIRLLQPIEVIEYYDGQTVNEDGGQYFRYAWSNWDSLRYMVTFKDGTFCSASGAESIKYNGSWYSASVKDDQSYANQWTAGNTYPATITLFNKDYPVEVSVVESPVKSIEADPVTMVEGLDSSTVNEWDESTQSNVSYDHYRWWDDVNYAITLKDGTVVNGSGDGFRIGEEWYNLNHSDTQSAKTPWSAGNTYTGTIDVFGVTADVAVKVEESPFASLDITSSVSIIEGTHRTYSGYDWDDNLSGYVLMKDGTRLELVDNRIKYRGETYGVHSDDDQTAGSPWTAGNTYQGTVTLLGMSDKVDVTIEENPVATLEVEPIMLAENNGGYSSDFWEGDVQKPYYVYRFANSIRYMITLKDGSVIKGTGDSVMYNGEAYPIEYSTGQSYNNRWLAGNTYEVEMTLLGVSATTYVTIESPVSADGFTYVLQDGKAILVDYEDYVKRLNIPSTVDGYDVVGVAGQWDMMKEVERVTIPDSVTQLSSDFFNVYYRSDDDKYINNLEQLHIGSGIASLTPDMFMYSKSLHNVTVSENNAHLCSVDGVVYNKEMTEMVFYPVARKTPCVMPASVTNADLLLDNMHIYAGISIVLGDNVEGYKQVDGVIYNEDMTVVYGVDGARTGTYVMPESVTSIARFAFMNSNLDDVVVSSNVTDIVYYAFNGSAIESVQLPDKIQSISLGAFCNCTNLASVNIPDGLTTLAEYAFMNTALTDITIPAGVIYFGDSAFAGSALESVKLCDGLEMIGSYAFADTNIAEIHFPDSITDIGNHAFDGTDISELILPAGSVSVGHYAFAGTRLEHVDVPDGASLGEGVFSNCTQLKPLRFLKGIQRFLRRHLPARRSHRL